MLQRIIRNLLASILGGGLGLTFMEVFFPSEEFIRPIIIGLTAGSFIFLVNQAPFSQEKEKR